MACAHLTASAGHIRAVVGISVTGNSAPAAEESHSEILNPITHVPNVFQTNEIPFEELGSTKSVGSESLRINEILPESI